jgi:mRNA-degrading endonuclease YafQ of YafQ-DinJ toxin-antitoxin module
MLVSIHKKFEKQYSKLHPEIKEKFKRRRDLFVTNPFHPILNNHSVDSAYPGWRSINITGDIRVLYEENPKGYAIFMKIGSHSQLY